MWLTTPWVCLQALTLSSLSTARMTEKSTELPKVFWENYTLEKIDSDCALISQQLSTKGPRWETKNSPIHSMTVSKHLKRIWCQNLSFIITLILFQNVSTVIYTWQKLCIIVILYLHRISKFGIKSNFGKPLFLFHWIWGLTDILLDNNIKSKQKLEKLETQLSKAVNVGKISIANSFKSCSLKL